MTELSAPTLSPESHFVALGPVIASETLIWRAISAGDLFRRRGRLGPNDSVCTGMMRDTLYRELI